MEAIAIIGIGCRFPGADNPEYFWELLHNGVDAITEVPLERWDVNAFYDLEPARPGKMNTRWGGFLNSIYNFDPMFFGISTREVECMDPQQRLMLEVAWEGLENAGIVPKTLSGTQTGVFIGITTSDNQNALYKDLYNLNSYSITGTNHSIIANRLSYLLNLRAPSIAIDTACSSSLVAVHLACQSLQSKESSLCIVGGVNLMLSPTPTIILSQSRMMASDGRCKTFDASADGYVRGEGCAVVVLKRFTDAVKDKDNILAVIRGSAVNQDGFTNGLTAPNGLAQQAVIREALAVAKVAPSQISYVEAHGTGTRMGDPIEISAIKAVLMQDRSPEEHCWIGSVKTNIGHLEAAAGIAGLIKVVLSLQHKQIPPHLHLKQLNQFISLQKTPFSIPTQLQPWISNTEHRLAGVSAFSFGGTNCHVILEEAPASTVVFSELERPVHLLTLSAKCENTLQQLAQNYVTYLQSHPEVALADVCYTANKGRSHFDYRLAVVAESKEQLCEQLNAFLQNQETNGLVTRQIQTGSQPKIGFLFTGQGSQYLGMGQQLYHTQPIFKRTLDLADEILRPYLAKPLLEVLYSLPEENSPLNETVYTQPALFALEYALANLWKSWGIEPNFVMGHSLGEYAAACIAGVFSFEDGLKLIAKRAQLMQTLPQDGEMFAVLVSEEQVVAEIQPYDHLISIAAINGPESVVVSGERQQVQSLIAKLQAKGVKTKQLKVSHAFHSPLMEPILAAFEQAVGEVTFSSPKIKLISNVTGELATDEIATPKYWCEHTCKAVQFAAGMQTLQNLDCKIYLEIGPKPTLLGMSAQCCSIQEVIMVPSLHPQQSDWQRLLASLTQLYTFGIAVDWSGFDRDYARHHLQLPTYPFQEERYWVDNKQQQTNLSTQETWQSLGQTNYHSLIGCSLPNIAYLPNQYVWQVEVDSEYLPYLKDHRLQGVAFMPGGVYLEMAWAAVTEIVGENRHILHDVEYKQLLILPQKVRRTLQVSLVGDLETDMVFRIHSRSVNNSSEPWILHATGKVYPKNQKLKQAEGSVR